MNRAKEFIVSLLFCIPAIFLIVFAMASLRDGIAVDRAIPVPIYMIRQSPLPKAIYAHAATVLNGADPSDGDAHLLAAEAAMLAGGKPSSQIPSIEQALTRSPANARGWMILSDAYIDTDRKRAAAALGQSMLLSSYDFWLAEPRAARAAMRWPTLDQDTRAMALRQALLLWEAPDLWQSMRIFLTKPQGVALVQRAFKDHQDELRDLNRWLTAERRRHPWGT